MTPAEATIAALGQRPHDEVGSWLAGGYLHWALESPFDPFRPHSIFDQYGEWPAEAFEQLYGLASESLQDALQLGVEKLGRFCRASCPESTRLTAKQRWDLLSEFARLSSSLICIRGAGTLVQIAIEDSTYWRNEYSDADPYGRCLGALENIAIKFDESANSARSDSSRARIEELLRRMVIHPEFNENLAPRLFYSLLCISPGNFIRHLELVGRHIARFHQGSADEAKLAYKTAERVSDKALPQFIENFQHLDLAEESGRDVWLVAALFHEQGPLRFHSRTATSIQASHRDQLEAPFTLQHSGFTRNYALVAQVEKNRVSHGDLLVATYDSNRFERKVIPFEGWPNRRKQP